ncbi:regucalcin-like [Sitodiplosis mosellana]|uniref:regucalcin-like n=1 Tax=Sitodiplosis mosellana TaxID=263140 RepID=UPI0024444786|nr:regucalcin-like [Sitodiplosis mosellana]
MSFKVEAVASPKTIISTRCHWDEQMQSVYYNDVEGVIYRYDYKENKVYSATVDGESAIGFVIPIANPKKPGETDEFAVAFGRRVAVVRWDGVSPIAVIESTAFEVEQGKEKNLFNAAKADPTGRFYGGTMRSIEVEDIFIENKLLPEGALYKYAKEGGISELVNNVIISNGLAWNEKEKKLFHIDSGKFYVKEYAWDPATGDISNERLVRDFSLNGKMPGYLPDGLTIDTDGNLYVTAFMGSKIFKVEPKSGKILFEIPIPAEKVTAVAFGGPNLDILYVTTGGKDDSANKNAGCLFQVTGLGAKGFPGVRVRI